nr:hypothetical protein CFP56_04263 [Quercus suber]
MDALSPEDTRLLGPRKRLRSEPEVLIVTVGLGGIISACRRGDCGCATLVGWHVVAQPRPLQCEQRARESQVTTHAHTHTQSSDHTSNQRKHGQIGWKANNGPAAGDAPILSRFGFGRDPEVTVGQAGCGDGGLVPLQRRLDRCTPRQKYLSCGTRVASMTIMVMRHDQHKNTSPTMSEELARSIARSGGSLCVGLPFCET